MRVLAFINYAAYFYPRSPCGERLCRVDFSLIMLPISIHALLAESDLFHRRFRAIQNAFLSTLSLRRATFGKIMIVLNGLNFYPRSPCGERRWNSTERPLESHFYPRSPCGERLISPHSAPDNGNFYPRSPCGERRRNSQNVKRRHKISIHALLAESDKDRPRPSAGIHDFYPRSPCGERLCVCWLSLIMLPFLSTLSLRRATEIPYQRKIDQKNFYPRSPCGERRPRASRMAPSKAISIHALLAESDI